MKLWKADYEWFGDYGAYVERRYIIIAETREVALGLALEAEPHTGAGDWTLTELDSTNAKAHFISSRCR